MVNRNLLAAKWTELSERLAQVRRHRRATVAELESDRDAFARAVAQWANDPRPPVA